MTLKELNDLFREGKTIDEILALRGESAKELLKKRGTFTPWDVLDDGDSFEELTQPQLQSLLEMIDNFSVGNYDYVPKEEIPLDLDNIKEYMEAVNNSYLFFHVFNELFEEENRK